MSQKIKVYRLGARPGEILVMGQRTYKCEDADIVEVEIPDGDSLENLYGGGNAPHLLNYSLEEQDTGLLFIDGKKIYVRTFTGLGGPANQRMDIRISNPGQISNITQYYGTISSNDNTVVYPLPALGDAAGGINQALQWSTSVYFSKAQGMAYVRSYSNRNGFPIILTLYYTKNFE